jgi:hypothetical protein
MIARVDPSLLEVQSSQVVAFHSWMLGHIVECEPEVGS